MELLEKIQKTSYFSEEERGVLLKNFTSISEEERDEIEDEIDDYEESYASFYKRLEEETEADISNNLSNMTQEEITQIRNELLERKKVMLNLENKSQ